MIVLNPRKLEKREVDALVASKLDWIIRTLGKNLPLKIYLFGSAAQDRMSETSDLDFALVYSKEQDLAVAKSLLYGAARTDDWPMDFLFYTLEDFCARAKIGGVAYLIANEGRLVFEKESGS